MFSASEARLVRPLPTLFPACDDCRLYEGCGSPKIPPDGDGLRRVLLVSEYPGREEDRQGRPLVGPAGRFLEEELSRFGVDMRRDCRLTNALICHDADDRRPPRAVADCRPNLLRTVTEFDPLVVVLLGGSAVRSLVGHLWKDDVGAAGRWWGWEIPARRPNVWVVPTYNPAHVMRDTDDLVTLRQFRTTLKAAFRLADAGRPWPDGPPDESASVRLLMSPGEAADWLDAVRDGVVSWDIETNMLKPDSAGAEILCVSVCAGGADTVVFPWAGRARDALARVLEDPAVAKIGYNTKFEDRWIRVRGGVRVRGWLWDGMIGAHLLDPRKGVSGLKFQAFVRLGAPDYDYHLKPLLESVSPGGNSPNRVREIKLEHLMRYCGIDAVLEYEVARRQMADLYGPGNEPVPL